MSRAAIVRKWIFRNSPSARSASPQEVMFPCPACGHESHYFNVGKGVGYCHSAKCHTTSSMSLLEAMWGSVGEWAPEVVKAEVRVSIILPQGCVPLVYVLSGRYLTLYREAVEWLRDKRHIEPRDVFHYAFQFDENQDRVVIPVLSEGQLVNYVSRAAGWFTGRTDSKRYMYAKGAETGRYLFNYEAIPGDHWAIVENTFNAVWLNNHFPCTSSFGSHLSKHQIELLSKRCRKVTLMWDHGAEERAMLACKKLRALAIHAEYVQFTADRKQPDDYSLPTLIGLFNRSAEVLAERKQLRGLAIA